MRKRAVCLVLALVMCLGVVVPTVPAFTAESQVPIIQSITIQPSEADPDFTITFTNVFDVFASYYHAYGIEDTSLVFMLDTNGTVSFNRDVSGMWGMRFIADRTGLHPAYGGIELAARAGEQISMSGLESFNLFFCNVESLSSIYDNPHQLDFMTVRTAQQRRTLAEWNTEIVANGSTPTLGRLSELAVPTDTTTPQPPLTPDLSTASPWAHESLTRAISLNLVPAVLQSAYTQPATRAEFAALAVALYQTATGRTITGRAQFTDTNDINVQKMAYLGVVTGIGDSLFNPTGQITREQAAVLLSRLAAAIGQPFPSAAPTFADNASLSSWAVDGVGQAQAAGIMGGVGDNRFAPQDPFTREQSIITILRMFDMLD